MGSMSPVPAMSEPRNTVVVVDDDPSFRESIGRLLQSDGLDVCLLSSLSELLRSGFPDGPTCIVLDVRLSGESGLDFQRELATAKIDIPIIFITGYGDIRMTVQAMKSGAIEFLTKPFRDQELLDAVRVGLAQDHARRAKQKSLIVLRERFDTLTAREREVMVEVARGRLNKQIAADLGISETTVKVHRSHVMHKMNALSIPDLTRMADRLKIAVEGR